MDSVHEKKYGVPVAARVKPEVAQELKQRAALRNQSLAQYLCHLITNATEMQQSVRRMSQAVVEGLAEKGMSPSDIEATLRRVNDKLQSAKR